MLRKLPISAFLLPLAFVFILLSFYSQKSSAFFPKESAIQLGIIVSFASLYLGISLMSHYKDKSLTPQIALEYILIATLVIVMVAGITL